MAGEVVVRSSNASSHQAGAPVEVVTPAKDIKTTTGTDVKIAPTLYKEDKGKPYYAKYTESEMAYDITDNETKSYMDDIDDYFKDMVKQEKYENSAEGYRDFIKKLETTTDSKSLPFRSKTLRIAEFIKYLRKING